MLTIQKIDDFLQIKFPHLCDCDKSILNLNQKMSKGNSQ